MRFVTRKNAAVDRIACPWLIRRFLDKEAEFLYVDPQEVARVAREKDAVPFDVDGAELGHVDGRCSFGSILLKYGLDDPALGSLAGRASHGDAMSEDIASITGTRLAPGTLYGAIGRLEAEGMIEPLEIDDRRRPYQITPQGRRRLETEIGGMKGLIAAGRRRLKRA